VLYNIRKWSATPNTHKAVFWNSSVKVDNVVAWFIFWTSKALISARERLSWLRICNFPQSPQTWWERPLNYTMIANLLVTNLCFFIFWVATYSKRDKKVKVKLYLCLIKHYAMKTWGSGGIAPPLLILALDGGEWSVSRHGRFNPPPGTTPPVTLLTFLTGGWVGPRAGLDVMEERNTSCLCRPVPPYTDWTFLAPL
jgi:hypothetical protein